MTFNSNPSTFRPTAFSPPLTPSTAPASPLCNPLICSNSIFSRVWQVLPRHVADVTSSLLSFIFSNGPSTTIVSGVNGINVSPSTSFCASSPSSASSLISSCVSSIFGSSFSLTLHLVFSAFLLLPLLPPQLVLQLLRSLKLLSFEANASKPRHGLQQPQRNRSTHKTKTWNEKWR